MNARQPSRPDGSVVIAVDLMGGDGDAGVRLRACLRFLRQHPRARLRLFIEEAFLNSHTDGIHHPRLELIPCGCSVAMDESPSKALRRKQDSSLARAVADVGHGSQAFLSAGNTGAVIAFARHFQPLLPGVEKPALVAFLPSPAGSTLFLDVGASVSADSEQLLQFGLMGAAMAQALRPDSQPRVALLNIGTETIKGHDTIWQADRLLRESGLQYAGYCEGFDLFSGRFDVIVTEGFVGNVALKSCEGMAHHLLQANRWLPRLPLLRRFATIPALHPSRHNGAVLLGFDALLVKSHGACDIKSYLSALRSCWDLACRQILGDLKIHLENTL